MIALETLSTIPRADWDAYVQQSATGLPYHLSGWQHVLQQCYGYETFYLFAQTIAHPTPLTPHPLSPIVGVLPMFFVHSPWVGKRAMTLPGGLCADTPEVAQALLAKARQFTIERGIQQLVLHDTRQAWTGQWQTSQTHHIFRLELMSSNQQLWQGLDRNTRQRIEMARQSKLRIEMARTEHALTAFYQLFSHAAHQAGTPIFAAHFLAKIREQFPDQAKVLIVYQDEKPIAGYFLLEMGQVLYLIWGSVLRTAHALQPAYLAYWELIVDACQRGFRTFDMGRNLPSSTGAHFKTEWGAISTPLYQQIETFGTQTNSFHSASLTRPEYKFAFVQRLWPKLPFVLAQSLGPRLRWHIPFV